MSLDEMRAMTPAGRDAMFLRWAEAAQPGFESEKIAAIERAFEPKDPSAMIAF